MKIRVTVFPLTKIKTDFYDNLNEEMHVANVKRFWRYVISIPLGKVKSSEKIKRGKRKRTKIFQVKVI